jgi:hypothetical protein
MIVDYRKGRRLMMCIAYPGLALLVLATLSTLVSFTLSAILFPLAILAIIVGHVIGLMYARCPQCGRFLSLRIIELNNCPSCGEDL